MRQKLKKGNCFNLLSIVLIAVTLIFLIIGISQMFKFPVMIAVIVFIVLLMLILICGLFFKSYPNLKYIFNEASNYLFGIFKMLLLIMILLSLAWIGRDAYKNFAVKNKSIGAYLHSFTYSAPSVNKYGTKKIVTVGPQGSTIVKYTNQKSAANSQELQPIEKSPINDQINRILSHVSLIVTYLMLFFTFIILVSGLAVYKYAKEYQNLKVKVESVDENLIAASSIALSTLPQLNYTFLIPERFISLYRGLSETVDNLIVKGEDKLLKYKNGAKILLIQGDLYFISDFVERAKDKWEKIYNHYDTPDDILRLAAFRLALGYNQLWEEKESPKIKFLNIASSEEKLDPFIMFLKYIWTTNVEIDLNVKEKKEENNPNEEENKKEIDPNIKAKIDSIKEKKAANIYSPEDIPIWFMATIYFIKDNDSSNAIKTLGFFTNAVYDYIQSELKNNNFNLVISWLASLVGLALFFIQSSQNDKNLFFKHKVDFNENKISLTKVICRLIELNLDEGLFKKSNKDVKLYWLPFIIEENKIKLKGEFFKRNEAKKILKRLIDNLKEEIGCGD